MNKVASIFFFFAKKTAGKNSTRTGWCESTQMRNFVLVESLETVHFYVEIKVFVDFHQA